MLPSERLPVLFPARVSTCGTGNSAGNGDIFVNDNITWTKNTLTLNAYRNIAINNELFGSGTARLYLYYGQGSTNGVIGGTTSDYYVNAPINIAAGDGKFRTRLGSDRHHNKLLRHYRPWAFKQ